MSTTHAATGGGPGATSTAPGHPIGSVTQPGVVEQADPKMTIEPRVAIALSGGAAKGDFEVGVLEYLYRREGVQPDILVGNSVGAINAAKLAEGADSDHPEVGLDGLVRLWRSLRFNSDMYVERELFSKLGDDLKAAVAAAADTVAAGKVGAGFGFLLGGPLGFFAGEGAGLDAGAASSDVVDKVQRVIKDFQNVLRARSLATLNPIATTIRAPGKLDLGKIASSGIKLRLSTVSLDDGELRLVDEHGNVLERDGRPSSRMEYDPKCADPKRAQIKALRDSKKNVPPPDTDHDPDSDHKPAPKDPSEIEEQIAALATALGKCPLVRVPLRVDLRDAIVASCSLPMIFEPVELDGMWYVDGGVRNVCPVEAAAQAGATMIYAVVASVSRLGPGHDFLSGKALPDFGPDNANLVDIAMRAGADIEPDENLDRDIRPEGGPDVPMVVIRPGGNADIHNGMTIDPGLIDIRIAQGFMKADDTLTAYKQDPKRYRTLTDQLSDERQTADIVALRHEIWKLEFAAQGWRHVVDAGGTVQLPLPRLKDPTGFPPSLSREPDRDALAEVRDRKRQLKKLIDKREARGGQLPVDRDAWFMTFERHCFDFPAIVSFPGPAVELWDATHPPPK